MSERLADLLNLELAWHRAKFDRPDRMFITHPYLIALVEQNLQGWLQRLRLQVVAGYTPSPGFICHVPKGKWQIRPGSHLRLADEVIYNALVGSIFGNVLRRLGWAQGDPDIAYQLADLSTSVHWTKRGFRVWREWREKSLQRLQTAEFLLTADISAFYENIDLPRLSSDTRSVGMDEEAAHLLSACLNRWSEPRGKGIPQGHSASDILAKLYLDSIDHNLRNSNFAHLRYVDDIRIFCRDPREAKRAIQQLSELLRLRGLNIQSAKTKIFRADEALAVVDGITPVIERINEELRNELRSYAGSEYGSVEELEELTAANPDNPPLEVLERAFRSHFMNASDTTFDGTLFRYLLTRLGATESNIAVEYCLAAMSKYPEETEFVLRYFGKLELTHRDHERTFEYLESPDALYEYQGFLVLRHYFEQHQYPTRLLAYCRKILRDGTIPHYVKSYAMAIVGEAGDDADLEFIEAQYAVSADDIQRATVICACHRMESGRRNAFFGRARNDGDLEERAVTWARAQN